MSRRILVDTGPIVALLDQRDEHHHHWAVEQFKAHPPPFLTCEAVLTEASHILKRNGFHAALVFELTEPGAVVLEFNLRQESGAVQALMMQYRNVPMDLADACLLRMTELHADVWLLTVDSDCHIYRRHGREAVPVIMP